VGSGAEGLRRVVSGRAPDGRSGVLFDGEATSVFRNRRDEVEFVSTDVWSVDSLSLVPHDLAASTDLRDLFTLAPGSTRFRVLSMPPTAEPSGWHRTSTIDYEYVVSGEVDLLMEDGSSVHLGSGDVNVQLGGLHQWWNRSSEPCVMVILMVGVESDEPPGLHEPREAP
jgi:hypothetical protein